MTDNGSDALGGWPTKRARLGTVAQLHALGQIIVVYNYCQSTTETLFGHYMPTKWEFSERLFHKLSNRDRVDLLSATVAKSERDPEVKAAMLSFLNHYDIATENRNVLMHAELKEAEGDVLRFTKKASNDPARVIQFRIALADLRLVADQMGECFEYGLKLSVWLSRRKRKLRAKDMPGIGLPPQIWHELGSLPSTPQKPRILSPYPPAKAHRDG